VQVVVPIRLLLNYRVVPVRVPVLGQPSSGYRVSSITVDPTNVTVCCSPSLLESLQFVSTDAIPITGTTSTVLTTTQLILPRGLELYPGQPAEITVTVAVEAIETTLQVSVAPSVLDLPPGFSAVVSPNKMELTLAGTFAQLQSLSPAEVKAVVSAQGLGAGTYTLTPQVTVPQGVKLELAQPNEVTVTLIAPTPVPTGTPHPTPTQSPQPSPSAVS
jgi:YbbR domain-containing protein